MTSWSFSLAKQSSPESAEVVVEDCYLHRTDASPPNVALALTRDGNHDVGS
jgi:hypothetical protein